MDGSPRYPKSVRTSEDPVVASAMEILLKELAVSKYNLLKLVRTAARKPEECGGPYGATIEKTLQDLVTQGLVKARVVGTDGDVIYMITADGVKEAERTVKKGVSALIR